VLLAAVAGAHTAYYLAPEGSADRGWIAYVATHLLLLVALALLLPWAGSARPEWAAAAGAVACWWGMLESAQAVGCSLLTWGTLSAADLCEQAFGGEVYAVAAALGLSWLLVGAWRRRAQGGGHG
jgi:hypothetical protein